MHSIQLLIKPLLNALPLDSYPQNASITGQNAILLKKWQERAPWKGHWLAWRDIMDLALYDPEVGYYGGKPPKLGRAGDFYTAVSVGPLYGQLVAQWIVNEWNAAGRPASFTLIEQGAHQGQWMRDILAELQQNHSACWDGVQVILVEPNPHYRAAQADQLLPMLAERLHWIDHPAELKPCTGVWLTNELLDAFPVHLVTWREASWQELGVAMEDGQWCWQAREPKSADLRAELEHWPDHLPEGFVTEVSVDSLRWLDTLTATGFQGSLWIADYGLELEQRWLPHRKRGTLRRYHAHQQDELVLEQLGSADLTSHICFTRLRERALHAGWHIAADEIQGRLLTRLARPILETWEQTPRSAEGSAAWLRQFQSLTHPGIMGQSFRVMILTRH